MTSHGGRLQQPWQLSGKSLRHFAFISFIGFGIPNFQRKTQVKTLVIKTWWYSCFEWFNCLLLR